MKSKGKLTIGLLSACASIASASGESTEPSNRNYPRTIKQMEQMYDTDSRQLSKSEYKLFMQKNIEEQFDENLKKESKLAEKAFKYTEAETIISKYNNFDPKYKPLWQDQGMPSELELKILEDTSLDLIKKATKETINQNRAEIELLKEGVIDIIRGFYSSSKGEKSDEEIGVPSLDYDKREEKQDRRTMFNVVEEITNEFGDKYEAILGGKIKYNWESLCKTEGNMLTNVVQGFETEASIRNFNILGQNIDQLKIRIDADQKTKARFTKVFKGDLNQDISWYLVGSVKYDQFPNQLDSAVLSLVRENPKKHSQLTLSLIQAENKLKEKSTQINLGFKKRF